ncbi:RNA polymerase sigma factor [bacterium RCC_150]
MEHTRGDVADGTLSACVQGEQQILGAIRSGDFRAFDELYRRHVAAARYVARVQSDNPDDADDAVSEAFAAIFQALAAGKGPDQSFRPYLLMVVRRVAHDRNRNARKTRAVDASALDCAAIDPDPLLAAFESGAVAKAFRSLPERWQAVLWHVDVERMKPSAAAPFMGLSPNAVSSLLVRAREGLRQAYLQNHISPGGDSPCFEYSSRLGKFARNALKRSSRERVMSHLEHCARCKGLLMELNDVQAGMRAAA